MNFWVALLAAGIVTMERWHDALAADLHRRVLCGYSDEQLRDWVSQL